MTTLIASELTSTDLALIASLVSAAGGAIALLMKSWVDGKKKRAEAGQIEQITDEKKMAAIHEASKVAIDNLKTELIRTANRASNLEQRLDKLYEELRRVEHENVTLKVEAATLKEKVAVLERRCAELEKPQRHHTPPPPPPPQA